MSADLAVSLLALALTVLLNVGGWIWFFATLRAKVAEIDGRVSAQAAILLTMPQQYIPRGEVLAMLTGITAKIDMLLERGQ